jgi:two-component system invasion response regulator UvrY
MIRVLIVDSHAVVREGVKKIVGESHGAAFFGEAGDAAEALKKARESDWDVVVLNLMLAGRSGLEVLCELRRARPRLPVLILSMYSEEQYARRAFIAGAAGYVTQASPLEELIAAVKKVAGGGRYVSPSFAEGLVAYLGSDSPRPQHESLSDREFEVMLLIASGMTVGEVAARLSLSAKTISTYRARILDKMGMKTNVDLMRYALRSGLVD